MSVKDLLANWEEALAVALSQAADDEAMAVQADLDTVADRRSASAGIRSNVHAGATIKALTLFDPSVSIFASCFGATSYVC